MPEDQLIADTNRLLRRLLEIDKERRAESERMHAKMEKRVSEAKAKTRERTADRLESLGVRSEDAEGADVDWDQRMADAQRRAKENIEDARRKDEQYKAELLQELRTQSQLLKRIAEVIEK